METLGVGECVEHQGVPFLTSGRFVHDREQRADHVGVMNVQTTRLPISQATLFPRNV